MVYNNTISNQPAHSTMEHTFTSTTAQIDADMRQFREALEKDGYEWLGFGCYGAAYAKPGSNLVMKIGYNHCNTSYLAWVEAVRSAPRHPNLPMMYGITHYKPTNGAIEFFVVVMERLESCRGYLKGKSKKSTKDRQWYNDLESEVYQVTKRRATASNFLVELIAKAVVQSDGCLDMHLGNIMARGTGKDMELVITDPIS